MICNAKNKYLTVYLLLLILCNLPLFTNANKHEFLQKKLGGEFRIILYTDSDSNLNDQVEYVYNLVDSLNLIFSPTNKNSEIIKLNTQKTLYTPSEELIDLMLISEQAYEISDGYFDITIKPASDLWINAALKNKLPRNREIKQLRNITGFNTSILELSTKKIRLAEGSAIDLGGIAKGYIIDKVYEYLKMQKLSAFLIEAAGDIRVFGSPPGQKVWEVGISSNNFIRYRVQLESGQSIATSGSTYRHLIINGKKHSHIINPKTIEPLLHVYTSTVIAEDAVTADYLASTLNIVEAGDEIKEILSRTNNVEFIVFSDQGISNISPAFPFKNNKQTAL